MQRTSLFSPAVFFLFLSLVSAAPERLTDPLGGTGGGPINGALHVRVVYDGTTTPVQGAFVMAGRAPGFPFPGNWGFTSITGEIDFNHPNLKGPIYVTAGAAGYQYFTLVAVDAADLVMPLKPISTSFTNFEVGDFVTGIDVKNGLFHAGDGNVDMAFVLPAMTLEDLMSFDLESLLGPMEVMEILGEIFEVPTNLFVPQQWELFIEIIKDHYYLYLPAGDHTITAMAGRISVTELLGGGDIVDLIPKLEWREIDMIDVTVTQNTYTADLNVDPDLNKTVTLNVDNVPEGGTAWCVSVGDLDAQHGLGRLIPLGLNTLYVPVGGGPGGGTVNLTTTAPAGKFAGMDFFPVAAVQFTDRSDILMVTERKSHSQTYTENLTTFYKELEPAAIAGRLSWNDVENPPAGSPDVHLQMARITHPSNGEAYWEFMIHGDALHLTLPFLPPLAPQAPVPGGTYVWTQFAIGLTYNLPSFDFNSFAFADLLGHGSHMAIDILEVTWPKRQHSPRSPTHHHP
jgi:hypothetical protein